MALDVDFVGAGSTTFRRRDIDGGLEPDQCYYTVNAQRMLGLRDLDLSVDPPPDLALEVDFTRSSLDRMAIYAALGVPEVWRWDAAGLHVYHLQTSGDRREYGPAALPVARLVDFLLATQDLAQVKLVLAARDWAAAGFPPSPPAPVQ
jgi:Uma2 family endonuclease